MSLTNKKTQFRDHEIPLSLGNCPKIFSPPTVAKKQKNKKRKEKKKESKKKELVKKRYGGYY